MSLVGHLKDKVFAGRDINQQINGNIAVAAPSAGSYATCGVGELIWDGTNDNWYICTVADTTWVLINA